MKIKTMELIWISLVVLTIFAYILGYFKFISSFFVGILLISTFIKGAMVSDYFMGLSDVSFKYRIIPAVWLFVVLTLVGVAYYI
jgi:hypothetical protein